VCLRSLGSLQADQDLHSWPSIPVPTTLEDMAQLQNGRNPGDTQSYGSFNASHKTAWEIAAQLGWRLGPYAPVAQCQVDWQHTHVCSAVPECSMVRVASLNLLELQPIHCKTHQRASCDRTPSNLHAESVSYKPRSFGGATIH